VISLYGGATGIRDESLLELIVAPEGATENDFAYSRVSHIAATLWFGLVNHQPFIDGNKRTGLRTVDVFLTINQLDLSIGPEEAVEWTQRIATGELSLHQLVDMIMANITSLGDF